MKKCNFCGTKMKLFEKMCPYCLKTQPSLIPIFISALLGVILIVVLLINFIK